MQVFDTSAACYGTKYTLASGRAGEVCTILCVNVVLNWNANKTQRVCEFVFFLLLLRSFFLNKKHAQPLPSCMILRVMQMPFFLAYNKHNSVKCCKCCPRSRDIRVSILAQHRSKGRRRARMHTFVGNSIMNTNRLCAYQFIYFFFLVKCLVVLYKYNKHELKSNEWLFVDCAIVAFLTLPSHTQRLMMTMKSPAFK